MSFFVTPCLVFLKISALQCCVLCSVLDCGVSWMLLNVQCCVFCLYACVLLVYTCVCMSIACVLLVYACVLPVCLCIVSFDGQTKQCGGRLVPTEAEGWPIFSNPDHVLKLLVHGVKAQNHSIYVCWQPARANMTAYTEYMWRASKFDNIFLQLSLFAVFKAKR